MGPAATISVTFLQSFNENPVRSSSSCEASTLERSRMSLMRLQQVVAGAAKDLHILVLLRARGVFASRSAMPMIAFIGVRIS
jgi:hypothetical protein